MELVPGPTHRTALVLSAGGMFGAYQAGAWKALERRFQPDMVIGASVGALNGWAIAGGCSGEELVRQWLDPNTASLLKLRFPGRLDPRPLDRLARELFRRYQPRIPFAATLVEVPRLRLRLVRGEEMTWQHLVAACSIPVALPAVRLNGRHYVDGGLLGALPVWAAAGMGATRVIAINALPEMPSRLVRVAVGAVRRFRPAAALPPGLEVLTVTPHNPMGQLRDIVFWQAENVRRWIAAGERDTAAAFH